MDKTAAGWQLNYTLGAGNYEYRFIVDGGEIIGSSNTLIINSLSKNGNSFLVVDPNVTFTGVSEDAAPTGTFSTCFIRKNKPNFYLKPFEL